MLSSKLYLILRRKEIPARTASYTLSLKNFLPNISLYNSVIEISRIASIYNGSGELFSISINFIYQTKRLKNPRYSYHSIFQSEIISSSDAGKIPAQL